jgi:hypothetical protein
MLSSQIRVALLTTAGMIARLFVESSFERGVYSTGRAERECARRVRARIVGGVWEEVELGRQGREGVWCCYTGGVVESGWRWDGDKGLFIYMGVERKGRKDAGGVGCLGGTSPGAARASDISWPCARDASCRYPSKATNRWIWSHHVFITRTFQINSSL